MAISLIPQSAPFSSTQRDWLNGFLAGALGLNETGASNPDNQANIATQAAQSAVPVKTQEASKATVAAYDRTNPFPATILEIRPLTRKDSEKDVRAVAFDLKGSGLTYEVGDALGVYPENCHELVESVLEVLGATGEEPVITPEGFIVPARVALAKAYVINSCNEELLSYLSRTAADPAEASRLAELADDSDGALDGQDVLDLLHSFPSTVPSSREAIGELIASLDALRPRLYSIASSLKAHPEQVHLTVGVVRYGRDGCDRMRKGVASTFLTERMQPGHRVGVFVHPSHSFHPPEDGDVPMIMVGPGTGIAPFRAFLQERAARGAGGKNWLFFGDQRRECDFLYERELMEYVESGLLTRLDTAFSRDQAEKIYVQQRMLENAPQLWDWLEAGAHFYVCGDARRMARDVDAALHIVVAEQGNLSPAEAKTYIANLAKTKRYQRDVY